MAKRIKSTRSTKNKTIQKNTEYSVIAYFFIVLFLCLLAYFVYFQVSVSETFINSPYNSLQDLFSEHVVRGQILTSDGEVLAETEVNKEGKETRVYPHGRMFAHVVGYAVNGKAGLENQTNFNLLRSHQFILEQIANDISGQKNFGDNVVTTLNYEVQSKAYKALGDHDGAVIVMEASTGKILGMVSKPDYNPNTIEKNWEKVNSDSSTALYNRATQGQYAPGSTFKIMTALEYYRENKKTYKNYSYKCTGSITAAGQTIHCAANEVHGNLDVEGSFAHSCNASFANMGLQINNNKLEDLCEDMLFNKTISVDFETKKSRFSLTKNDSDSLTMETCIGQGKTLVSPLHMAMISAAICNDGVAMKPYLVDHTENYKGAIVESFKSKEYKTLMSKKEAAYLEDLMKATVESGTGTKLKGQSYQAYGKTGTAQVADSAKKKTNAWFVGYAKKEGYEDIAIAVIVEDSGYGSTYAVPVAKSVFDAYFN